MEMDLVSEHSHENRERYVLFSEARSRYERAGGMLEPSAVPNDGLSRVIVDHHRSPHAEGPPPRLKTRAERIAFLRGGRRNIPTYPQIVGQAAAASCGLSGVLWAVGEMRREFAEVLTEAGLDVSVFRTGVVHSLVVFRLDAGKIGDHLPWPPFDGDYGLRLFGFDREGGELERTLERLEMSIRRDTCATETDWARLDAERAQRPRRTLGEQITRAALGTLEDVPPATAADVLDQWRVLLRLCWSRPGLYGLCQDAFFCVLPDGPHHSEVSFNSLRLAATDMASALSDTIIGSGLPCSIVENHDEEYLRLSDLS